MYPDPLHIMKSFESIASWLRQALRKERGIVVCFALTSMFATTTVVEAFPPAPHHLVYGQVRDEFGNPFHIAGAIVFLEAEGLVPVQTEVVPGQAPGVNYQLRIPLDSGVTSDLYKPTALRPTVPFRMRVRVGSVNYLPMEMTGITGLMTRPGEATRVDLTLGIDSDGDGLPDAWEYAMIDALGGDLSLADIHPGDDPDGDGLTNLQEYLAGTYAFDPEDGFSLAVVGMKEGSPLLEFTALRGRSYKLYSSNDMTRWDVAPFLLTTDTASAPPRSFYTGTQVRKLRVQAGPFEPGEPVPRFFKVKVY